MKLWRISKEPEGYFVYRRWYWWPFWRNQNPKEYDMDYMWIRPYQSFTEAEIRMSSKQHKIKHWYF